MLRLRQSHFLSNPLQSIIYLSPYYYTLVLFSFLGWFETWVHLVTSATNCPTVPASDGRWWVWNKSEWELAGETEVLGENLPLFHFVHYKSHALTWARTEAAAVGSRRLTAWAMARTTIYDTWSQKKLIYCFQRKIDASWELKGHVRGEIMVSFCVHVALKQLKLFPI
jgi:hypothetical protein